MDLQKTKKKKQKIINKGNPDMSQKGLCLFCYFFLFIYTFFFFFVEMLSGSVCLGLLIAKDEFFFFFFSFIGDSLGLFLIYNFSTWVLSIGCFENFWAIVQI